MPKVSVRRIHNFNKERLVAGFLPTSWFLVLGLAITVFFMLKQPKSLLDMVFLAFISIVLAALMTLAYRISHTRIIQHWIRWHDSGVGGLVGRDIDPVPHRYVEITKEEQLWFNEQRKKDIQRAQKNQRGLRLYYREKALRKSGRM